ncbi:MAG: hypothetical protein PHU71_03480 [Candidatus Gracilibacteria bacterium]|nr:hypothetical protein [Candidatus Gracilibacteria bacterium]
MVESSISENAKFEEVDRQELILSMDGTPLSEEEIISRIEGRRVGYGIKTVIPQTDWHNPIKSLNHLLFWNQRGRVRDILEILSRPEEGDPMVDIKSLEELEGSKEEVSGDLAIGRSELAAWQKKLHEIEKIHEEDNRGFWEKILQYPLDDSPDQTDPLFRIGVMNMFEQDIRKIRSKLFFALTPAGLEYKKLLEPREKLRKEAARNKLCAEIDAREAGRKGLEATS